jgi:L-amino acid N-acyltransferase YncA
MTDPTSEGPRAARTLRLATPDDARQVAEIYAPSVELAATSFELSPPSEAEMRERLRATLAGHPWLVCEEDGRILGYAYASAHRERAAYRWSADVSVYVREGHRRGGLGRALYAALLALLRLQGLCAAHAGITLPNPASVGLHQALGFRPIGVYPAVGWKLGAWHDVGWWQLPLRERRGAPPALLSMEELRRAPAWEAALAEGARLLAPGGA